MIRRDLIRYPDSRLEIVLPSGQAVLWKDVKEGLSPSCGRGWP